MNCGYEIKWSYMYDLRSYEPVTSWYRYNALTNWAMKPLTLGAGHLWVLMFPWGMNQWWNDIWNGSYMYMNCGYEIKWSYMYDPRSYEYNFWLERCTSIARSRVQTSLKSWIFQASLRNCKNCVHNCEDHSFTWFHIRSSYCNYMIHFIYHFHRWFIPHGNIRTHKWPAPNFATSVASHLSWLERPTGITRSRVQIPLKSWIFQASLRNCKNCVHDCKDYSFTWIHCIVNHTAWWQE